jgi:hypothetical protein
LDVTAADNAPRIVLVEIAEDLLCDQNLIGVSSRSTQ